MQVHVEISVVIPTFGREAVLVDTLGHLLNLQYCAWEIIVIDQSPFHERKTQQFLEEKASSGKIEWMRLKTPSITHAMNTGLLEAKGAIVLFLDDDIIPDENIIAAHLRAHEQFPEAWVVVGQVLQPENGFHVAACLSTRPEERQRIRKPHNRSRNAGAQRLEFRDRMVDEIGGLLRDLDFKFNSSEPAWIENVMAGNLSVKRKIVLHAGGFDENFIPPVSYRFETEFAKRMIKKGGKIRFEPSASIKHLRARQGGTRSRGSHLTSASPIHAVGDYYYALRCGHGAEGICYMLKRPFREIFTKFHLRHPWYLPIKLIGELRALRMAIRLNNSGNRLLSEAGRSE